MKLWILRPISEAPWEPWYDKAEGFVVRAESEQAARQMADGAAGSENHEIEGVRPWLMIEHSSCEMLTNDGAEGMIIVDFHSA